MNIKERIFDLVEEYFSGEEEPIDLKVEFSDFLVEGTLTVRGLSSDTEYEVEWGSPATT